MGLPKDLRKMPRALMDEEINYLSGLPLKVFRKRQNTAREQIKRAIAQHNELLLENWRVHEYLLNEAIMFKAQKDENKTSRSPRKAGGGPTHVRSHARKGTRGVRAHTRRR